MNVHRWFLNSGWLVTAGNCCTSRCSAFSGRSASSTKSPVASRKNFLSVDFFVWALFCIFSMAGGNIFYTKLIFFPPKYIDIFNVLIGCNLKNGLHVAVLWILKGNGIENWRAERTGTFLLIFLSSSNNSSNFMIKYLFL